MDKSNYVLWSESFNNADSVKAGHPLPISVKNFSTVSTSNSTATALAASATFTGTSEDVTGYTSVICAALTDQDGILYMEFSTDNTNWDSSLAFNVFANTNEIHRLTITRKYFRIRFTNTSSSAQTFLRLQTLIGTQQTVTSALNSVVQLDADTIVVRPLDFNLMVAQSQYQNHQNTIKDGINQDISASSVPEDIWQTGGTYTGFPISAEAAEIVISGADTGTVYYSYLESITATDYVISSKAVTGAGTYSLGHNIRRCSFAYFVSSSATDFNLGTITVRHSTTTTNIFCQILTGYSQSYCAAYTVPYGSSAYFDRLQGAVRGNTTANLEGFIWYRPYGESPRLRFPFVLQFGSMYFDDIDYLIRIPERTDIMPRITFSSGNNIACQYSYRIVKVKT